MKLKTRIMLIFFSLTACIVLACAIVMALFVTNTLRQNTMESANALNKQTSLALNNILSVMDEASLSPVLEPELYQILRRDYPQSMTVQEKYAQFEDMDMLTNRLYSNVYYRGRSIWGITLYMYNAGTACYRNKGSYSPNLENLAQQPWYKTILSAGRESAVFALPSDEMYAQAPEMLCMGRVLRDASSSDPLAVIRVDVPLEELNTIWETAMFCEGAQLLVRDQFGNTLYSSLPTLEKIRTDVSAVEADRVQYYVVSHRDTRYGYKLSLLVPFAYIKSAAFDSILLICVCALVCMMLATFAADLLIDRIMQLIRNLNQCMKEVRRGDLNVQCEVTVGGEFGEVCESFNLMVDKTRGLIQRIYREEEQKRQLELQALQAQISPHFLLNTLNAIKWMAFLQGNKSIETALNDLAHILRFAIRDTNERISIRTELEQLEHYLHILSIRYPNLFTVDIQADPEVLDYTTLKFMLQPFLENSIFHGFDGLDREGRIEVKIQKKGEHIRYTVLDNGHGIPPERLQKLVQENDDKRRGLNRIGINNVTNRIHRIYGEEFGVQIKSRPEEYTRVTITIPARLYTQEQEENFETDRAD